MASPVRTSSADNPTVFLRTNKAARINSSSNTMLEVTRGDGPMPKSLLSRTGRQALSEVANSTARFIAFSSSSGGKPHSNELFSPIKGTVSHEVPEPRAIEARSAKAETCLNPYDRPAPTLSEHVQEQMSSWKTEHLSEEIETMTLYDDASDDLLTCDCVFAEPVQLDNSDCKSLPPSPPNLLASGPLELDIEPKMVSPNWKDYLVDVVGPCLDVSLDLLCSQDDSELIDSDEEIESMFPEDDAEMPLPKEFERNNKELDALRNIRTFFYCKAPLSPPTPPCLSPPLIPSAAAYEETFIDFDKCCFIQEVLGCIPLE